MARMLFTCTYGQENPERATLPFVAANVAAQAGQDTIVLLTVEGAWLGRRGAPMASRRPACQRCPT